MKYIFKDFIYPETNKYSLTPPCRIKAALLCAFFLSFFHVLPSFAAQLTPDEALEAHRAMEVQTNQISNWPAGPAIGAESAITLPAPPRSSHP